MEVLITRANNHRYICPPSRKGETARSPIHSACNISESPPQCCPFLVLFSSEPKPGKLLLEMSYFSRVCPRHSNKWCLLKTTTPVNWCWMWSRKDMTYPRAALQCLHRPRDHFNPAVHILGTIGLQKRHQPKIMRCLSGPQNSRAGKKQMLKLNFRAAKQYSLSGS